MHGAGNDFILIDGRKIDYHLSIQNIQDMCSRRTGIGADGLMILETDSEKNSSFFMRFYNADGSSGAMCGNGGRCIASYAYDLLSLGEKFSFRADDGMHEAEVSKGQICLKMADMDFPVKKDQGYFGMSGTTPHLVLDEGSTTLRLEKDAAILREEHNANVNFVHNLNQDTVSARTYERGVENETLACGTGACVIAAVAALDEGATKIQKTILMPGGKLRVSLLRGDNGYTNCVLSGPSKKVYTGYYSIDK